MDIAKKAKRIELIHPPSRSKELGDDRASVWQRDNGQIMINIVLFQPEIPQNTGNIIRLAANTGCRLHLIKPLGFDLEEKKLRRAGLDYHEFADVFTHESWADFRASCPDGRFFGVSTKGENRYSDIQYEADDYLIFGPETRGLPDTVRSEIGADQLLRIPMRVESRSLNLSNAVAIMVYEAWRQLRFETGS